MLFLFYQFHTVFITNVITATITLIIKSDTNKIAIVFILMKGASVETIGPNISHNPYSRPLTPQPWSIVSLDPDASLLQRSSLLGKVKSIFST